jgi:TldD protein
MKKVTRREFLEGAVQGGVMLASLPLVSEAMADSVGRFASGGGEGPAGDADTDLMRVALERGLRRGGDFADVYRQRTSLQWLELEDDKINKATVDVGLGLGVRVVKGDQVGYAYTEELTREAVLAAADTASLIASGGAAGTVAPGLAPVEVPRRYPAKTVLAEVDLGRKMDLVNRANARARKADPRVERVNVVLSDVLDEVVIATSDGRLVRDTRPRGGLFVSVVASHNGRKEKNGYHMGGRRGWEFYSDEVVHKVADEAVRRTVTLFDAVVPPAGTFPVVLAPGTSGILLHEAIGHGLEGDFNRKHLSVYADRVGQKVCSDLCTIVDDGTISGDSGSMAVDDEGTPTERTVLIDKGVLRGYMHDRISSTVMKARPTGNGRRESYKFIVWPRMRTTYMEPGPHSLDEIVKSVDKGIYAVSFGNGQVNIGPGDFSFYINYGHVIENGRIGAPIKDVNLIGNGPEVLGNVTMVAGDLVIEPGGFGYCGKQGQRVPVGFGLPHVKVSAIAVGGVKG